MHIHLAVLMHGSTEPTCMPINLMDIAELSRSMDGRGRVTLTDGTKLDIMNADDVLELMMMNLEDES